MVAPKTVVPAQAGTEMRQVEIPACAGMTDFGLCLPTISEQFRFHLSVALSRF